MYIGLRRYTIRLGREDPQECMHEESDPKVRIVNVLRQLAFVALILIACNSRAVLAQTPSPLQEWQYSGGIILARLFQPDLPKWRTILGVASEVQPVYDGARAYRVSGGPVINIHYRDIAFLSTGEGLGFNFLRGDHYQVGLGVTFDLGRKEKDDPRNLHGMGDISAAPVAKMYGSWVLSRRFPLILRVDARQFMGGAQGLVGDAAVYLPLPGSSKTFVMFAGPSITLATHHYLQTLYGVSPSQAAASGHPVYEIPHTGTSAAGVGFSATKFVTEHWLLNLDAAISQVRGSPAHSPLVERRTQRVLALSFDYNW
ncbi:MAG: mltA-interacting MipA family protein [Gammaproteobacteria bacterium]|nr:mltA-interacting MipA family protein [Gammaproteobacteria bacterium]